MNAQPRTRRPVLALAAVAGPVLFVVAWIVLGFVNTGYTLWGVHVAHYNPIQQQISALGVGNTAPYMNTTFILTGLLLIAGAVGIFAALRREMTARARKWTLVLWILPGVGSITDGIFTFEHAMPHFAGFALSLSAVAGFAVTGAALRHSPTWRNTGRWLIVSAVLTVALTVLFFATFTPTAAGQLTGIAGLTERILVTEIMWWYALLGWTTYRASSQQMSTHRMPIEPDSMSFEVRSTTP
jgi:hypothetical membrane protein